MKEVVVVVVVFGVVAVVVVVGGSVGLVYFGCVIKAILLFSSCQYGFTALTISLNNVIY